MCSELEEPDTPDAADVPIAADAADVADAAAAAGDDDDDDEDGSDAQSAAGEEAAGRAGGARDEPDLHDDLSLFADDDDGTTTDNRQQRPDISVVSCRSIKMMISDIARVHCVDTKFVLFSQTSPARRARARASGRSGTTTTPGTCRTTVFSR